MENRRKKVVNEPDDDKPNALSSESRPVLELEQQAAFSDEATPVVQHENVHLVLLFFVCVLIDKAYYK